MDIKAAPSCDPIQKLEQREHHILELAYDQLTPLLKELLSRLAAYRSPVNFSAVEIINPYTEKTQLKEALIELEKRNLIWHNRERGNYDMHQVVREYAYRLLDNKVGIHKQLRDYYNSIAESEKTQDRRDLKEIIELFHHTVNAGLFDEAFYIYSKRLSLVYRAGAYQIHIKLLRALFPDGEDLPPRLQEKEQSREGSK